MSIRYLSIGLVISLLLSACSVGPNFNTPTTPTLEQYTSNDETHTLHQAITMGKSTEDSWWNIFSSPTLNQLIQNAIAKNYELTAAKETLAQAQEAVNAESGNLLPQAAMNGAVGRQKYGAALFGPANFNIPPFTYYELGPSISWTPDLFGGGKRALERQQALAAYQAHELDATLAALTGDAVATAMDIAATHAEINAQHILIAEDKKTSALVHAAYQAGSATKENIFDARNQFNTDLSRLPLLQQRLSISRHALSILAGDTPDAPTPDFKGHDFSFPATLPITLPSELVKNRPDILAAESNLHAASAAIGVATANLYPQITLSANMMQEALTPAGIFNVASNAWALASGFSAPIFNGGALHAEKRSAIHAYQAALAQYRQTILIAFQQVADALTAVSNDNELVTLMQNTLHTAIDSYTLSQASYQAGAIGLLQLQDIARAQATAQLALIQAQHQRNIDTVRLFIALGGHS